jgi:two-component system, NarL family, sensor histidine kinase UhpB
MNKIINPFRGIAGQLTGVALIPPFLLFIAITVVQWQIIRKEAIEEMREHANIAAATIGESIAYNLISGNNSVLERSLSRYMASDKAIAAIAIFDTKNKIVVEIGDAQSLSTIEYLDAPILNDVPTIQFGGESEAKVMGTNNDFMMTAKSLGTVRIYMQIDEILAAKKRRLVVTIGLIAFVTFSCAFLGLALARRLNNPLRLALNALHEIEEGNLGVRLEGNAPGAFKRLHQSINAIAVSLSRSRASIELELRERTASLIAAESIVKKQNNELEEINAQLRDQTTIKNRLIAQMNSSIEEERKKLSHEIHDRLNANLIAIKHIATRLKSIFLDKAINVGNASLQDELVSSSTAIENSVDDIYKSSRAIIKTLRPEVLDTLGLSQAIHELITSFSERYSDCSFTFREEPNALEFGGDAAITAYRMIQESLTNAVKHAHASSITVRAFRHTSIAKATIVVTDNGHGFDTRDQAMNEGIGLISMRERAQSVNGELRIDSRSDGTRVSLDLPLDSLARNGKGDSLLP